MTNVTEVIRPIYEGYINQSAIESNFLHGSLLNVMPLAGRVSRYNSNSLQDYR
jgi:hypothetical protein